jgi:hypothetical protein
MLTMQFGVDKQVIKGQLEWPDSDGKELGAICVVGRIL